VTRFAADLLENAAAEGARQRRSARQQLDHWARGGRAASSRHSAARRKVEAALACELDWPNSVWSKARYSTPRSPRRSRNAWPMPTYGEVLAGRGITTVALNEEGDIVEHRPNAVRSW